MAASSAARNIASPIDHWQRGEDPLTHHPVSVGLAPSLVRHPGQSFRQTLIELGEVVTEAVIGSADDPSFLGSRAAFSTRWTSASGTNSSCVEWMTARGDGDILRTIDAVLKVGSFGVPCVM